HEALYAYRMHGQNKHSNAAVVGGAYNSSTCSWPPIRQHILEQIHFVLLAKSNDVRRALGDERYASAEALLAHELGLKTEFKLWEKAAGLVNVKLKNNGGRNLARNRQPLPRNANGNDDRTGREKKAR